MTPNIPENASLEEIKLYMKWMDAVVELGWKPKDRKALSDLWWQYHPPADQPTTTPSCEVE